MTEKPNTEEQKPETPAEPNEPDGTEWVDDQEWGSPKARARFERVYGHLKSGERKFQELQKHNQLLASKLEELIAKHETAEANTRVERIQAAIADAKNKGDSKAEAHLQVMLTQELQPKQKQSIPVPQIAEEVPTLDLSEAQAWEAETDNDGNFLRPWAQPTHPRYGEVHRLTTQLIGDPSFGNDVPKILAEIDKRMGTKKPQRKANGATALSSSARPSQSKSAELTAEEISVARKMGITPQDYAKQKQLLRTA